MKNFNFVITTGKDITSTSNSQGSGWISVNVFEHQLPITNERIPVGTTGATGIVGASVENIALAQICPSETFSDFSSGVSFDEFSVQTLSNTALFSDDYFPSNTYGIDTSQAPSDILESNILTCAEKGALTLAISLREAGHYVLVIPREGQTSYQNFLKKYNIFQKI